LKVLGLAGSPRRGGNTDLLLAEVMKGAASKGAETRIVYLSELQIAPCRHCDSCLAGGACIIQDDMQTVYRDIEESDRIVLATPLHFMSVTAQMKLMMDRCQTFWARKYVLKVPPLKDSRERKGLFVSVGGRRTIPDLFEAALVTVKTFFRSLNVQYAGAVVFRGIDARGDILKNPEYLQQAFLAGQKLIE
jgi:multimeric flavodoxin WrbA